MSKSPEKPLANEAAARAADAKGAIGYEALRTGVGAKGGAARLSGRRAHVKGMVASIVKIGAGMDQILIADPKDSRHVAYLITLPRGDENEFEVGQKAELDATFVQAVWKPGYKGTLLLM